MQKSVFLLSFAALMLCISGCSGPEGEEAKTEKAKAVPEIEVSGITATYEVHPNESVIEWVGSDALKQHNGILDISACKIYVEAGKVVGGHTIIDMTSLIVTDRSLNDKNKKKLTNHLKSEDFFHVEKYPEARFEITGCEVVEAANDEPRQNTDKKEHTYLFNISGNLTIKDSTKSITFPAKVTTGKDLFRAEANFNIDRTKWGVRYRSDKSLGDKMIHHDMNIGLMVFGRQIDEDTASAAD